MANGGAWACDEGFVGVGEVDGFIGAEGEIARGGGFGDGCAGRDVGEVWEVGVGDGFWVDGRGG